MFLVVGNAGNQEGNQNQSGCNRRSESCHSSSCDHEHQDTSTHTENHTHEDVCRSVEVVTFTNFQMDSFRERSAGTCTSKALFNLGPVLPCSRIFQRFHFLLQAGNLCAAAFTAGFGHLDTILGHFNLLAKINNVICVGNGNIQAKALAITSDGVVPVCFISLLVHTGTVGEVDVENQTQRAKCVKGGHENTHLGITLPAEDANHNEKAVKDQENQELSQSAHGLIVTHHTHLSGELEAQTF